MIALCNYHLNQLGEKKGDTVTFVLPFIFTYILYLSVLFVSFCGFVLLSSILLFEPEGQSEVRAWGLSYLL